MSAARPETGATDDQIYEAVERMWGERTYGSAAMSVDSERIRFYAGLIVPPGSVIALAEHVVDAADREAIGQLESVAKFIVNTIQPYQFGGVYVPKQTRDDLEQALKRLARLERLGSGGEEST